MHATEGFLPLYLGMPSNMQLGKGYDSASISMLDIVRVSGKYRLKEQIGSGLVLPQF